MLTGIEATIQESEPLMIQQASVTVLIECNLQVSLWFFQSPCQTADSEEPGSLTHDRREPSESQPV
ncbi:hypothetical protein DPMN_154634 [Dreissena polymorpha]|uniref:Uncharacterized protein n=1 Tax=Dreissena polymorpha TaxID=45954 RepID=A0A9D4J758_DREPO|nr:hypothetical protein DPMN_154634 [Dreissena polymorpha]